jgi:ssDNA-binding Zn-finger/Zn-ribbon topoisomerase 1
MLTRKFVKDGKASFFLSCSNYPACKPAERPAVTPLEGHGAKCTKCAKGVMRTLVVRKDGPNQGKKFLGCSEANCKNMVWPEEVAKRAS